MEEWVMELLESERSKRGVPLEAKSLNGNYYLYRSTTKYDRKSKKSRKVSEYIGRMTPSGVVERSVKQRSVYEYGNSALIRSLTGDLMNKLKKHFPDSWNDIYALAVTRLLDPVPMRSVKERWDKLYMSRDMDAHISPDSLSHILRDMGMNQDAQDSLFADLMIESRKLAFDLSSIFSRSETVNLSARGHNHEHMYLKQINMALIFDMEHYMPVCLRPVEGSVKDVKALRNTLEIMNFHGILVMDRGFTSHDLSEIMDKRMKFLMPLRRNQEEADYNMHLGSTFMYRNRGILCGFSSVESHRIYMFYDPLLAGEEASTFISLISNGKRNQSQYDMESCKFGKIAVLSNINDDPEQIYLMYKQREEIEQAFDAMKNEMENDRSYLRDDESLRGYFFISFLSLYMYYTIFVLIRAADLTSKYSVKDVLLRFSRVYRITGERKEYNSEVPASLENLDKKLGTNLFPKN